MSYYSIGWCARSNKYGDNYYWGPFNLMAALLIGEKMRVTAFLNVSNKDNMKTDSGLIFYDILSREFVRQGVDFSFVAPVSLDTSGVTNIPMNYGSNKYEARFSFDWEKVRGIFEQTRPDVVIVNQIELLANFRAVAQTLCTKPLLVGYAHYVPFWSTARNEIQVDPSLNDGGIWSSISLNFMSGLEAADHVFIHSNTSLKFISDYYKKLGRPFSREKFSIIPPPYDDRLCINQTSINEGKKIVYNHRLYAHYGTSFLTDLAPRLTKDLGANLMVFDVMSQQNNVRIRLDSSPHRFREILKNIDGVTLTDAGKDRAKYKMLLSDARCALAPFRPSCVFSMACIDCLSMGIPVVAPDFAWFAEFIPSALRFKNIDEAATIVSRVLSDDDFWVQESKRSKASVECLAPNRTTTSFIQTFNRLANQHSFAMTI